MSNLSMRVQFMQLALPRHSLEPWSSGPICESVVRQSRLENSHQPTKLRVRLMRRFKSPGHGQCFLSAFGIINSLLRRETSVPSEWLSG